jgi:hypothetical protein
MLEYIGMASANLAWVAWREGNLAQAEEEGRAALDLWRQLPAAHSSCAFQWTALWPLVGVAHTQGRIAEATEWARPLFERTQQRVPEALTAAVMRAIEASDAGESEVAPACLEEAIELAQDLGYL